MVVYGIGSLVDIGIADVSQVYKTSWASLSTKQAITVGSSSDFNVIFKSLCHQNTVSLMPISCLSLTNTRQETR